MQLLKLPILSYLKRQFEIKRVKLSIKKMSKENQKAINDYQKISKYYQEKYPENSMRICAQYIYAVRIEYKDIFLSQETCLKALQYFGFENPTFMGISLSNDDKKLNFDYRTRAFFKFQLTDNLNALITIGNTIIFIVESQSDTSNIRYSLKDSSNDSDVFQTTIICENGICVRERQSAVRLKFEVISPKIVIQSLESSFVPSYPWDPDQKYSFYPNEDEEKVKNLLFEYYNSYYHSNKDLVQTLENYCIIDAN